MKSASPGLIELLNSSQQVFVADLYEITVVATGNVYRYTSGDRNIFDASTGHVFFANGPLFKRSKIKSAVGLKTGELAVRISVNASMQIESQPWLVAARIGVLDSAQLTVWRAFMPMWGDTSNGLVELFTGHFSDVDIDGTTIYADVKNVIDLLDVKLPKNLYQTACLHALFDEGCALSKAALTVASTVSTAYGAATKSLVPVADASAARYWDQGIITFLNGPNAGIARTIKTNPAAHLLSLTLPLPFVPVNGNSIQIVPGCNKTIAKCESFGNRVNFRGYPFIPVAETAQ